MELFLYGSLLAARLDNPQGFMECSFEITALSKPDMIQPNKTKLTQAELNSFLHLYHSH
jgi:hypothetical protein